MCSLGRPGSRNLFRRQTQYDGKGSFRQKPKSAGMFCGAWSTGRDFVYAETAYPEPINFREVVRSIREEILALGATVHFDTRFVRFLLQGDRICGVEYEQAGRISQMACEAVILATGHSARDTFIELKEQGVVMQPKAFAVGVRMEHPQEMIGLSQYGEAARILPTGFI